MTDISPHTGSSAWLYRIFEYQAACGSPRTLKNDKKVNAILRNQVSKNKFPKVVRHRAIIWNTPANMYANFIILSCSLTVDFVGICAYNKDMIRQGAKQNESKIYW